MPFSVRITLAGGAFADADEVDEKGQLELVSTTTGAHTILGFVGGFVDGEQHVDTHLVPGRYDVAFEHWGSDNPQINETAQGYELPINRGAPLGCRLLLGP